VILEPACALMALRTGLPVRLTLDRRETILGTRTREAAEGRVRTVADREGHLLHREMDLLCDGGAYATGGHRITMAMGKKVSRLYRIPSQSFRGRTVFTNTTPSGACRGYGSPQIHAITEIHLDLLARRLNMDPTELRRRNLVGPYDPDPAGGPGLGNARIRECLDWGARAFRWADRAAEPAGTGRYRVGAGMACATHGNGYFGSPYPDFISMALRICEDGSVLVNGAFHELGNGTLTTIGQIVAEALVTTPDRVWVSEADTHLTPFDVGCVASRVTYVCGACAQELAERVRGRLIDATARLEGCDPDKVILEEGRVMVGDRSWSQGELACRAAAELKEEIGDYLRFAPSGNPASFGAHFARVRVDTLTGMVRVTDYLAAHDVGRAINPKLLRGQIYGGVQMGLGMALCEELKYDPKGYPLSASFARYDLVNAPDMPEVEVVLVEEGEPGGPYGAKSIGEIATVPVAPAVVNAINRALGTELTRLPLTPERILAALHPSEASAGGEAQSGPTGREGREKA
jgi:xanthine dehydrogenase molybdenum-binding subunit